MVGSISIVTTGVDDDPRTGVPKKEQKKLQNFWMLFYFHFTFCQNIKQNFLNVLYATLTKVLKCEFVVDQYLLFNTSFVIFTIRKAAIGICHSLNLKIRLFLNVFLTFRYSLKKVLELIWASSSSSFLFCILPQILWQKDSPSLSVPSGPWLWIWL